MPGVLKVYVDTSVWNYVLAMHLPENQKITVGFIDAIHVAVATIYGVDALVTWNCKDMANISKRRVIEGVNLKNGYLRKLEIVTPMGVDYEVT